MKWLRTSAHPAQVLRGLCTSVQTFRLLAFSHRAQSALGVDATASASALLTMVNESAIANLCVHFCNRGRGLCKVASVVPVCSTWNSIGAERFALWYLSSLYVAHGTAASVQLQARLCGVNKSKTCAQDGDLEGAVQRALEAGADAIVSSGGVSMGDRDLIKPLLERSAQVHCGRVLMKPGKPLTFATMPRSQDTQPALFFGLPGAQTCHSLGPQIAVARTMTVQALLCACTESDYQLLRCWCRPKRCHCCSRVARDGKRFARHCC